MTEFALVSSKPHFLFGADKCCLTSVRIDQSTTMGLSRYIIIDRLLNHYSSLYASGFGHCLHNFKDVLLLYDRL